MAKDSASSLNVSRLNERSRYELPPNENNRNHRAGRTLPISLEDTQMNHTVFIAIDGKYYRWKDIVELRRIQLAAAKGASAAQLALFTNLKEDRRPAEERTASARFAQSNLFETDL